MGQTNQDYDIELIVHCILVLIYILVRGVITVIWVTGLEISVIFYLQLNHTIVYVCSCDPLYHSHIGVTR